MKLFLILIGIIVIVAVLISVLASYVNKTAMKKIKEFENELYW